jgi:hypothetical protein
LVVIFGECTAEELSSVSKFLFAGSCLQNGVSETPEIIADVAIVIGTGLDGHAFERHAKNEARDSVPAS